MRLSLPLLCLFATIPAVEAVSSPVLNQAVGKWLEEGNHWAFTVQVREFEGGTVKEEREERYDPSHPGLERWQLVTVDGKPPTDEQRAEWQKRKAKRNKQAARPLADLFDLERATALDRTGDLVRYRLPLRNNHMWLFPVDRIGVLVTVDRKNLAVEKIEAGIDAPYHVALGLARILDVDFDVQMHPAKPGGAAGDPATARPAGTARVVVNNLGQRIEYAWSGFQRVTPHPDNVTGVGPKT